MYYFMMLLPVDILVSPSRYCYKPRGYLVNNKFVTGIKSFYGGERPIIPGRK
ncbi:hypothetical protein RTE01_14310 [Raoultella terrigena]|nr:hypothetical protein RTE01_14310 [Raoultella terrigena]